MNFMNILCLLSLISSFKFSYGKRKRDSKDWNKVDFNDVEKNWQDGDSPEELEHEFEQIKKIQERKRRDGPKVNWEDPKQVSKLMKTPGALGGGGSSMAFIDLIDKQLDGKPWDKFAQDHLAGKWSALLRTASLTANVYNLEDKRMLISIDRGWMASDVMKFILKQPETVKLTLDNKDYFPSNLPDDDDDL